MMRILNMNIPIDSNRNRQFWPRLIKFYLFKNDELRQN